MKDGYKIIVDYVEGGLSSSEFKKLLSTDKSLIKILKQKMSHEYGFLANYDFSLYNYLKTAYDFTMRDWSGLTICNMLQEVLCAFLDDKGILYNVYKGYGEKYGYLLDIQPTWLDISDDGIFQQILDEIPQELSKTQRIKLGKERVKELFKYDKTYPRWIQSPEWPIVNGKPLVFSHQEKVKDDDFHTYYYFYNEDTKEQTVIEQFS